MSKATLDAFYNGSNYILRLPRLLSTFYDVDHVTKVKKLLRRYRGRNNLLKQSIFLQGGSMLENLLYQAGHKKYPKKLILILCTGASFGLTSFRSDFIEYVKCDIPVKDVKK